MKKSLLALQLSWAAVSVVGRVRRNNEDSWGGFTPGQAVGPAAPGALTLASGGLLLLVSDGMGGAQGGEEASRFCIERCAQEITAQPARRDHAAVLQEAFVATHAALVARAQATARWRGMGATLSALWLHPDGAGVLGHIGDSRIYQRHGDALQLLTEDHNLGASMVRRGELTEEAVTRFKYRALLEQVMGGDGRVLEPQIRPLDFGPGDSFILCSDGFYGPLRERTAKLLAHAMAATVPAAAVQELADAANAAGGPDNITVLLARVAAG